MIARAKPEPTVRKPGGIPVALYDDYDEGTEYYECLMCGSTCSRTAFCGSCGVRFTDWRDRVKNYERRADLAHWAQPTPYFITKIVVLEASRERDYWRWYHDDPACKKEMDDEGTGPGPEWDRWNSIRSWDIETVGAVTAWQQARAERESFLHMHHDGFCKLDDASGLWISTDVPEKIEDREPCGHGRVRFRLRVCDVYDAKETDDSLGLRVEYRGRPGDQTWSANRDKRGRDKEMNFPGVPVAEWLY